MKESFQYSDTYAIFIVFLITPINIFLILEVSYILGGTLFLMHVPWAISFVKQRMNRKIKSM